MRKTLYRFFVPPVFPEDEDKTRSAAILNVIGWSTIVIVLTILILRLIQGQDINQVEVNFALITVSVAIVLMILLTHRGFVRAASVLLVSAVWIGLGFLTWAADGIRDVSFLGYVIPILMAGLLLGWRGALFFTLISILAGWVLAFAQTYQLFFPTLDTPLHFARDITAIFVLVGVLIFLMITSLQKALNKSRAATQELSESNRELNHLRVDLEQRVEERTYELRQRALPTGGDLECRAIHRLDAGPRRIAPLDNQINK